MILNEANDLSYVQKFKDAENPSDIEKVLKEFCKSVGFAGYNEKEWNSFIGNNLNALYLECSKYGLSMDNPFFQFLNKYSQQNGNITPFVDRENYSILHNCVSNGVLETKQLSFTCPEVQQVRILVNRNLWNITPKSDILYLIKVYVWLIDENLNSYILNAYVKAAFSDQITTDSGKIDFKEPDMNSTVNKIGLLKCLLFTDYVNSLSEDRIKNINKTPALALQEVQKRILSIKNQNMLISKQFKPVDLIEQQIGTLRERAQESNRDVSGRYQQTDTEYKKSEYGSNSNERFSVKQKAIINQKAKPIIDAIKTTYGVNNLSDIKDILKVLGNG